MHIWDAITCAKIRTITGHTHRVGSLSWSGHILASGSKDRSIRLRDTRIMDNSYRELNGHKFVYISPSLQNLTGHSSDRRFVA